MLHLTGIIITFFLTLLLLSKKHKSEADKILAIWLLLIGLHLASFYLYFNQNYIRYPYFLGWELPLPFVHAPLLYLYTASLTNQSAIGKYRLLHFLPVLLVYILFLPFLTSSPANKINVYQQEGLGYKKQLELMGYAIILSGVLYITLSLLLLKKHKQIISEQFSYSEKINLNWLRYLILGMSLIWLVIIFGNDVAIFSVVVFFVLFIGYFGIKQVGIFTQQVHNVQKTTENEAIAEVSEKGQKPVSADVVPVINESLSIEESKPEVKQQSQFIKYQKSGLSDTLIREIHQQLTILMEQEKWYKNPELTLSELAQQLKVLPNNLSQVINSMEGKNFYDYINVQRIEEFKRVTSLPESRKFTLLSLAFECGFNSKTSFNRNFKKATALSPTEYLNQQNIALL